LSESQPRDTIGAGTVRVRKARPEKDRAPAGQPNLNDETLNDDRQSQTPSSPSFCSGIVLIALAIFFYNMPQMEKQRAQQARTSW